MTLDDLRSLDVNDIARWPGIMQTVVVILVCLMIGGAGYWFVVKSQIQELQQVKAEEETLRNRFEARQRKAAGLEDYKAQLAEMEERFSHMLRQLPGRKEVASLLQDVSQLRVASGLEEQLFQPEPEQPKDFYAELPIRITLLGDFHQYGDFAEGVAALPRIVTLHDIVLKRPSNRRRGEEDQAKQPLVMTAKARTYRYLEEGE
ncbi:MAG: type 4a pilus biogenesis protein PilO [Gammaproteobacteria bacterium]|nr:type 4a pilus biogenesis protein PilO [Gammaproteobacteria bacterium]